jgi:hypothetical protein
MKKVLTTLDENKEYTKIVFKKITEIEGDYEISNKGHVRSSIGTKKILTNHPHGKKLRVTILGKKYNIEDLINKYHQ